jgi:hypothetical protein
MKRLVVVIAISVIASALFSLACGDGNNKPPLTPDSDHPGEDGGGGGAAPDGGK